MSKPGSLILLTCVCAVLFLSCAKPPQPAPAGHGRGPEAAPSLEEKPPLSAGTESDISGAETEPEGLVSSSPTEPAVTEGKIQLPPGWPEDVPVMPEAALESAGETEDGLEVVMTGRFPPGRVVGFYSTLTGWSRQMPGPFPPPERDSQTAREQRVVLVRGSETLTLIIMPEGPTTRFRLVYKAG